MPVPIPALQAFPGPETITNAPSWRTPIDRGRPSQGYRPRFETGCQVIQVFTKNTNQWRGKPITPEGSQLFQDALAASGIACPLAHDSYLINLASPDPDLWKKSIDAMIDELQRASMLGIPWVVAHPGAYVSTSEARGLRRIVKALNEVLRQGRKQSAAILLETTAGQGTTLGWRFEHLATILAGVHDNSRLGVCFDTCHVFAAGYKMSTEAEYQATTKEFNKIVGTEQILRLPSQRQRERLRQPRRSARPHRCGQDRSGTIRLAASRLPLARCANGSGDAQGRQGRRKLRRDQSPHAARAGRVTARIESRPGTRLRVSEALRDVTRLRVGLR